MTISVRMPDDIRQIIAILEAQGHEAWLVGGSVRDCLLSKVPRDWDVATSASLPEIQEILEEFTVVPIGAKFGTLSVVFADHKCEVSTFRGPTLVEDLARRDFSINAIAWHPRWGLQDPHDGRTDLKARTIRCPSEPLQIFAADALRMLRAARFSAQLGFDLEPATESAIKELHALIQDISPERIREELSALLISSEPRRGFELLRETGLLAIILPELQACVGFDQHTPHHDKDVYQHILAVVENTPPDLILRLAALLHDIAKPLTLSFDDKGIGHFYGHEQEGEKLAGQILRRLRYDNNTIATIKILVREHMQRINYPKINPAKLLARVGKENIEALFTLQEADAKGGSGRSTEGIDEMRRIVNQALAEKRPFSRADLAITGKDLLEIGVTPGAEIGRILDKLLDAVIKNPQLNTKDQLLTLADPFGDGSEMSR